MLKTHSVCENRNKLQRRVRRVDSFLEVCYNYRIGAT